MLRAGIVGCGKIADQHAANISKIPFCRLVAVCDREELMARQLADRFGDVKWFTDVNRFLEQGGVDVVHITTPAQSHMSIGKLCIEHGCHVYVEKPFTLDASEAEELLKTAETSGKKLTVGHNLQFSHASNRMRKLIRNGYLGDGPVHIESYYGYDLGDTRYAKAVLGDKNHWVRQLPGKLMHNLISHGISKISEFIPESDPLVIAHGFTSPVFKQIGEDGIIDELRVIIVGSNGSTAYFTFSTQIRPVLRYFKIFGENGALAVDEDEQTLVRIRGKRFKSYLQQFLPNLLYSSEYLNNLIYNAGRFLVRDFHVDYGMKKLMENFYDSIRKGSPVPIPYQEILSTTKIMDSIFSQVFPNEKDLKTEFEV